MACRWCHGILYFLSLRPDYSHLSEHCEVHPGLCNPAVSSFITVCMLLAVWGVCCLFSSGKTSELSWVSCEQNFSFPERYLGVRLLVMTHFNFMRNCRQILGMGVSFFICAAVWAPHSCTPLLSLVSSGLVWQSWQGSVLRVGFLASAQSWSCFSGCSRVVACLLCLIPVRHAPISDVRFWFRFLLVYVNSPAIVSLIFLGCHFHLFPFS